MELLLWCLVTFIIGVGLGYAGYEASAWLERRRFNRSMAMRRYRAHLDEILGDGQ